MSFMPRSREALAARTAWPDKSPSRLQVAVVFAVEFAALVAALAAICVVFLVAFA